MDMDRSANRFFVCCGKIVGPASVCIVGLRGLAIQLLVTGLGSFITAAQDPRQVISIIDEAHTQNSVYLLRLNETPRGEKSKLEGRGFNFGRESGCGNCRRRF